MFAYTIDTQIQLRLLTLRDTATYYDLLDRNREHLGQWEEWLANGTRENVADYIKSRGRAFAEDAGFLSGIWYRADDKSEYAFVGAVGGRTDTRYRSMEIGYWLDRDHTGRGIVSRSVRGVIEYAFGYLELERVMLIIAVGNTPSRAIAERLGFTLDGIMRHDEIKHGKFIDQAYYTLLREEWRQP